MKRIFAITTSITLILTLSAIFHPAANAADKNPYGTSTLDPAGPNEIIFSVSKGNRKVDFTESRLLKMKSSVISIYEPFVKKRQTFTVVPIKNFFAMVGISDNDKVITMAINDYSYANTAAKFAAANSYIAIKRNGKPIPYDQGGPLRLVFDEKSKWSKELDAWNWSLSSISVK
jgi:hypothetical protein